MKQLETEMIVCPRCGTMSKNVEDAVKCSSCGFNKISRSNVVETVGNEEATFNTHLQLLVRCKECLSSRVIWVLKEPKGRPVCPECKSTSISIQRVGEKGHFDSLWHEGAQINKKKGTIW